MNLTALLADLYRDLNFGTSPASAVTTRLTARLNEAQRKILTSPGMERLRDDIIPFASVASRDRYCLPPNVARIKAIVQRTNMRRLKCWSLDQLRTLDPGQTSSGTPYVYVLIGYQAVAVQPSAATGLWAASSSASDTSQTVYVQSVVTGGYPALDSKALNGTTRVQIGATSTLTTHEQVTKFYLSAVGVGSISLYDAASAGNELARIAIGQTYSRYLGIQLYPTPSAIETFYVDYTRVIPDLVLGTDEPLLPEDFHWLLNTIVRKREYEKTDDTRYAEMVAEEKAGIKALRDWVLWPPDYNAVAGVSADTGSNLGGHYPSGRW